MQYRNFDLEVYEYEERDGRESFSVRVTHSPVGDQSPSQAERVELPEGLRAGAAKLQRYDWRDFALDEAIAVGTALADCILPARVRQLWSESLRSLGEDEALRLRFKFDAWQVADLPWELAYIARQDARGAAQGAEGFLALDRRVSIVHYEYTDMPFVPFGPGDDVALRQLILLSDPRDLEALDLEREASGIGEALRSITNLALEIVRSPTIEALQEAVERPTHIFHFAGHGAMSLRGRLSTNEGVGTIVLCDASGEATLFPADKLALNLVRSGVRIAFLNCELSASRDSKRRLSGLAPALAHSGIPAVIGLNGLISDRSAIAFSRAFYRSLAAGNPVDLAVTSGRLAICNQGEDEWQPPTWAVPTLYLRSDDSTLFPIRPRQTRRAEARAGLPSNQALRQALVKSFSVDELRLLCDDITAAFGRDRIQQRVDLEIVGGTNLETYALNLVEHLERRDLLSYLADAIAAARPGLLPPARP